MRLLIADDDRELACAIASYIRHCNEAVVSTVTTGGLDVLRSVSRFDPDVILMDIIMPKLNGISICRHILSRHPNVRIILLSGTLHPDHPFVIESGASAFLSKPVRLAELQRVIQDMVVPADLTTEEQLAKAQRN